MSTKYSGIKSSIRKVRSVAQRMHDDRVQQVSLSARAKSKPLQNTAKEAQKKFQSEHPSMPDRTVRIMPFKEMTHLVPQVPESPLTMKGLSLKALVRGTPKLYKYNAREVVIESLAFKKTRSGLPAAQAVCYSLDSPYGKAEKGVRKHKQTVIGLDSQTQPISKQRRVLVSCSCEAYVFNLEYANATYGAGKIVYGNGDAPNFTNPGQAYGLCKHLYTVAEALITKGK
jgi:hypothetical protein